MQLGQDACAPAAAASARCILRGAGCRAMIAVCSFKVLLRASPFVVLMINGSNSRYGSAHKDSGRFRLESRPLQASTLCQVYVMWTVTAQVQERGLCTVSGSSRLVAGLMWKLGHGPGTIGFRNVRLVRRAHTMWMKSTWRGSPILSSATDSHAVQAHDPAPPPLCALRRWHLNPKLYPTPASLELRTPTRRRPASSLGTLRCSATGGNCHLRPHWGFCVRCRVHGAWIF